MEKYLLTADDDRQSKLPGFCLGVSLVVHVVVFCILISVKNSPTKTFTPGMTVDLSTLALPVPMLPPKTPPLKMVRKPLEKQVEKTVAKKTATPLAKNVMNEPEKPENLDPVGSPPEKPSEKAARKTVATSAENPVENQQPNHLAQRTFAEALPANASSAPLSPSNPISGAGIPGGNSTCSGFADEMAASFGGSDQGNSIAGRLNGSRSPDGGGHDRESGGSAKPAHAGSAKKYFGGIRAKIERYKSYPEMARRRGIEGRVVVRFVISRNGKANEIKVLESSSNDSLDQAAIRAVKDASPFGAPPESVAENEVVLKVPIIFTLD